MITDFRMLRTAGTLKSGCHHVDNPLVLQGDLDKVIQIM
jgi:hypothetical protein